MADILEDPSGMPSIEDEMADIDERQLNAEIASPTDKNSLDPSDEELTDAIRKLMEKSDLSNLTVRNIRDFLTVEFGDVVSRRREFIDQQILAMIDQISDTQSGSTTEIPRKKGASTGKKATKRKKESKKPKKPIKAYMLFRKALRERMKDTAMSFKDISKLASQEWRSATDEEKFPFQEEAVADERRYHKELEEWNKIHGIDERPSKKKKTKKREEQPVQTGEEPEISEFDKIVERLKPRRRKLRIDDETADEMVSEILHQMDVAYQEDMALIEVNQPATKKLKLIGRVIEVSKKQPLYNRILDEGLLLRLRDWLRPLQDGTLPNISVRTQIYELLNTLPIEADHLLESIDDEDIGLGKILMNTWRSPYETDRNKTILRSLIEKWLRPMMQIETNYKKLAEIEAANQDEILRRSQNFHSKSGVRKDDMQSRYPQKPHFDFVIRPKSRVNPDEVRKQKIEPSFNERLLQKIQKGGQ